MSHPSINYRPEVDGLRAYSLILITLYHAHFPVPGGYVGVEVFFVISGYLITAITLREVETGRFTYANFYWRRARRIAPALIFITLATLVPAWFLLIGPDMRSFSAAVLAVVLMAPNLYFWKTTGYFDLQSDWNPLLHTWTLGVEEQFYLIYPLCLVWLATRKVSTLRWAVPLVGLASLAFGTWGSYTHPYASFYLLPMRAWEFLAGAWVAVAGADVAVARYGPRVRSALAWFALALLVVPVAVYDKFDPMPGLYTVVPVAGASLFVMAVDRSTTIGRLFAWKPLVWLGVVSYSTYLWHQPVFAYLRLSLPAPPGTLAMIGAIVLTLVLGWASWKWVEVPARSARRIGNRAFLVVSVLALATLVGFGLSGVASGGFPARYTGERAAIATYADYDAKTPYRDGVCFLNPWNARADMHQPQFLSDCRAPAANPVAIMGDSYAAALSSGFRWGADAPGVGQYTVAGCPPLVRYDPRAHSLCVGVTEAVFEAVVRDRPKVLVLHANWPYYDTPQLADQVAETLAMLKRRLPQTQVVLLGGMPQWYTSLPARMLAEGLPLSAPLEVAIANAGLLRLADDKLARVAADADVGFRSVTVGLCRDARCDAVVEGEASAPALAAWDNGHLTQAGARHAIRVLGLANLAAAAPNPVP